METIPTPTRRRIAKPLGVYLITAFDAAFIGLFPLALLIWLDNEPSVMISPIDYYVTAALRVIVVAAALGAVMGENLGRRILLWAVTAVSISMILSSVNYVSSDPATGTQGLGVFGNIPRAIFWVVINWWYFNRKEVVAYYRQNTERERQNPN